MLQSAQPRLDLRRHGVGERHYVAQLIAALGGGGFKLQIQGRGIDLSVVGRGSGFIEAQSDAFEPGVYSLDGADCRKSKSSCEPLPDPGIRFKLGAAEKAGQGRPGSD